MHEMLMAHQEGCTVIETEQLKFYLVGTRCLAVLDAQEGFIHDHYAVDERARLAYQGAFRYLRVAILSGHTHIGPVIGVGQAADADLHALSRAASAVDAGLALSQWARRRPQRPHAA